MKKLQEQIAGLEKRIRELEARPPMIVYPPVIVPVAPAPPIPYQPDPWWMPIIIC